MGAVSSPVVYSERLSPSVRTHLVSVLAGLGTALAVSLFGPVAAVVAGLAVTVGISGLLIATAPVVRVTEGGDPADGGAPDARRLHAGGAVVPVDALGEAQVLDADGLREAIGPGADVRDHVCHRSWVRGGVRVAVVDPRDPTPSWVVCTRRPTQLIAALGRRGG